LRNGFWETLSHHELLLYIFLILVSDRNGLSYYKYDNICTLLKISVDAYIVARNALIEKDLIAFDGHLFQVLSLPDTPVVSSSKPIRNAEEMQQRDPATVRRIIHEALSK
jgi:hypothetical protein